MGLRSCLIAVLWAAVAWPCAAQDAGAKRDAFRQQLEDAKRASGRPFDTGETRKQVPAAPDPAQAEAERERRERAEAAARLMEEPKPPVKLKFLYVTYLAARKCHKDLEGYAAVYINELEWERIKKLVKQEETRLVGLDPTLTKAATDKMWEEAQKTYLDHLFYIPLRGLPQNVEYAKSCVSAKNLILETERASPIKKDF